MSQDAKQMLLDQIEKLRKAKESAQTTGQTLKKQAEAEEKSIEETSLTQPE